MSKVLPERIDIARLADSGATIQGLIPVALMARLADQLSSAEGTVQVELVFSREDGREVVHGRVTGQVQLVCQRCLGGVEVPVDVDLDLVRVASEIEAEAMTGTHDPFVAPNRELALADLVEDEVLLALPLVPVHGEDPRCEARAMGKKAGPETRQSPFAALAAMKKKRRNP